MSNYSQDIDYVNISAQRAYEIACLYNLPVPQGELAISQSAKYSFKYAHHILRGRFLLGEEAISKQYNYSFIYAKYVIRGAFPPGELAISKSARFSLSYAAEVLKGPFPLAEKLIADDASAAVTYATEVLKSPFPEGELKISKSVFCRDIYIGFILNNHPLHITSLFKIKGFRKVLLKLIEEEYMD